ncbi:hypothetical protein H6G54_21400 [Anabaena cylindrica FACHB-243]|uniref:hypothetical protein n=1 Tax=Anabaena TaxID=1163 RepID=UPI000B5FA1C6|nr:MULTISPECIES: hypothetical protein [Anabaena]MBD2420213.1 hypothetical protein [Anabaena cylindrica FACHB-243]MBY5283084.1 hypothetical protein [Anabaena sp. CCAP 1446/1C]MBY5307801.1 hypothetical protein [Anabaena sp. CCAP 1446/1C]MCM2406135.1 hypothetical protein [Anabaena sp. CCAP 1446/1C]BAY01793.1 hypothetical protein NIES19_10290 [Anabaena cylindrica PCC 7122]
MTNFYDSQKVIISNSDILYLRLSRWRLVVRASWALRVAIAFLKFFPLKYAIIKKNNNVFFKQNFG